MKWIEIIRVGLGSQDTTKVLPAIAEFISTSLPHSDLESSHILTSGDYAGQIMVILVWEVSEKSNKKSDMAYLLQKELKHFGMIDYSAWMDQVDFENKQFDTGKSQHKIH